MPGHSGAPVLNKNGQVVGVIQGGIVDDNVAFALPINQIHLSSYSDLALRNIPTDLNHQLFAIGDKNEKNSLSARLKGLGLDPPRPEDLPSYAEEGNIKIVADLLAWGLQPDARPAGSESALFKATEHRNAKLVHMLLAAGADRYLEISGKKIIVEAAVRSQDKPILAMVLGYDPSVGLDPNPELFQEALEIAQKNKLDDVVDILRQFNSSLVAMHQKCNTEMRWNEYTICKAGSR